MKPSNQSVNTARWSLILAAGALFVTLITVVAGCGGGGGNGGSQAVSTAASTSRAAHAQITVHWPARTATTRLIPVASNSIRVTFLSGTTVLQTQLLVRPNTTPLPGPSGESTPSPGSLNTTAMFSDLPQGAVVVQAVAYPNYDGTGTAQASAQGNFNIVAGQDNPIGLALGSTIDHLILLPAEIALTSDPVTLSVSAYDVSGNMVLTNSWQWTNTDNTVALLVPGLPPYTNTATLQIAGTYGMTTVTVTETESGKSLSEDFDIQPQFGASYFGRFYSTDSRTDSDHDIYTHPQLDGNGNPTGVAQVDTTDTTYSNLGIGFADEAINDNVDQYNLPGVGNVNRTSLYDDNGVLTAQYYWNSDATGYTNYGTSSYSMDSNGNLYVSETQLSTPVGQTIPANLTVGQTVTQQLPLVNTYYNSDGTVSAVHAFTQTFNVTLEGYETVTVPAGTFQDAAKLHITSTAVYTSVTGMYTQTNTTDETQWSEPYVGGVKAIDMYGGSEVNADGTPRSTPNFPNSYEDDLSFLYGSINGVQYGSAPGKAQTRSVKKSPYAVRMQVLRAKLGLFRDEAAPASPPKKGH